MQRITFTSARGDSVELYQSPFFLNKIEGLGDVESDTQTQKAPNQDGSTPITTTLGVRSIPIEVVILDDLLANRQLLSRVFNPRLGPGTLTYQNDIYNVSIQAQSDHVPTFPDDRPRRTQRVFIDLTCYDPYFTDGIEIRNDIAFWEPTFHFPLVIPKSTGITMGIRNPSQVVNVYVSGHTDTGMIIQFKANRTLKNPTLTNVRTGEYIKIIRTMVPGEVITVNTNARNKKITSTIDNVTTNIFNDLEFGSKFLQLLVGDNLFRYGADESEENLEVSLYHYNKYVGV